MDMNMTVADFQRKENESDDALFFRIVANKDKIGSWYKVADILNEIFGTSYSESKYRKEFKKKFIINQNKNEVSEDKSDKDIDKTERAEIIKINNKLRELKQAEVRFRDERNAWNKQNTAYARLDKTLDYLEEKLSSLGAVNFNSDYCGLSEVTSDNDMLIMLTDLHIGETFDTHFGCYNSEIAKMRLEEYLKEIIEIQKIHNSEDAYVVCLGDLISSNIHFDLCVTNRENMIDQIKIAIELISNFVYELTKHFNNVYFSDCSGNHSRMTGLAPKETALHDERIDNLIGWCIGRELRHIDNFSCLNNYNYDTGITSFNIRGKAYIGTHGDYDSLTKQGINNLIEMLKFKPSALLMGHRHVSVMTDEFSVRVVQGGSLSGTGSNYTIEHRISGQPSQTICICNNKGICCVYPIELH
jgi:hypothetical protein